jgi:hypothetical protein
MKTIEAVIGSYADYLHFHFSLNEEGKLVPDYSLGEFILPPGTSAKQLALETFGVFVKEEDFA